MASNWPLYVHLMVLRCLASCITAAKASEEVVADVFPAMAWAAREDYSTFRSECIDLDRWADDGGRNG